MTRDFKHSFKAADRPELSLVVYNAGFQKCPPGYGWGPGIRDHFLIHYILSGRGHCQVGEDQWELGAGDAFLGPQGHSGTPRRGRNLRFISFRL